MSDNIHHNTVLRISPFLQVAVGRRLFVRVSQQYTEIQSMDSNIAPYRYTPLYESLFSARSRPQSSSPYTRDLLVVLLSPAAAAAVLICREMWVLGCPPRLATWQVAQGE